MVSLYVAITDEGWFQYLRALREVTEVNFWQPGGRTSFGALNPGELFLFKLHSPKHYIVGGGVFAHATSLPISLAWEAFGDANGAPSLAEMRRRIAKYRRQPTSEREDYEVGCRLLEQPFFLDEDLWIAVPKSWHPSIQVGKTYRTDEEEGLRLWEEVQARLQGSDKLQELIAAAPGRKYGEPTLITPRLGQGSFRVLVTDAYKRRCALTNEKVLPALEAAHIRPYAEGGDHAVTNGLLVRRDVHSLFDRGYVTVSPDYRIEISRRIKEDFDNGQQYYQLHGAPINLPDQPVLRPGRDALEWHNLNRFLG